MKIGQQIPSVTYPGGTPTIRPNPRLMVAVGDAAADFSIGLIEAVAEPVDVPVPEEFFAKYADELAEGRLYRAAFAALYTQAMRVVPTRFLARPLDGTRPSARSECSRIRCRCSA